MDKRLITLLSQDEVKPHVKSLLFNLGYSESLDEIKLTEKAKAILNKKHVIPIEIYNEVSKLFKQANGVVNTLNTVNSFYGRMIKANDGKDVSAYDIIESCKYWLQKSSYPGELKYFFFKDTSSRCLDGINTLKLSQPKKTIAERV